MGAEGVKKMLETAGVGSVSSSSEGNKKGKKTPKAKEEVPKEASR